MVKVLFAWELGGGLGHLVPLAPIVAGLRERGHEVFLAARDLRRVDHVFGEFGVNYLQIPFSHGKRSTEIRPPRNFAQILNNCGFGDVAELRGLTAACRSMLDLIRPDLIVCDHAPGAFELSRRR